MKTLPRQRPPALGDPASVPAGQYAQEALTNLGLWDEVSAKASFGTNVTEVLNWVAEEALRQVSYMPQTPLPRKTM